MDFQALNIRTLGDLDRLPWFERDPAGLPVLNTSAGIPAVIDTHSHLGWSYGLARAIDMAKRSDHVRYLYDFDLLHDNAARLMGIETL